MLGRRLTLSSPDSREFADRLSDPRRAKALRQSGLLDSVVEPSFDRLTRLTVRVLGVPVALVSLVDEKRQFFKSQTGLPEPWATQRQTPLSHSFCKHVVATGAPLIIEDARVHPLVRENRAIAELGVVAYAGIPLVTPGGAVLGSFCAIDTKPRWWSDSDIDTLKDLAASVMTEIVLKSARDAAEAASRAKDRFLAVLSHELRTPVSPALMIATSMAEDASLDTHVREDARTIQRNIELQTRLIDDLLDVTRIENGKLVLQLESVCLHDVLSDCIAMCRAEAESKGVTLSMDTVPKPPIVRGDPSRLRQVFINLLKNGVKFTPPGGRVTIDATPGDDGWIRVTVADTGIGIEPEMIARIFDPFEQVSRAITNEFSGLGLGLAISKGIIEAHGGAIRATSDGRGAGTRMTIELPLMMVAGSRDAAPAVESGAAASIEPGTSDKRLSILVVDDHRDTLMAMSRLLKRLDHDVTTADCKASALAAAADGSFDLLISDIGLPDGTGLELMREMLARRPIRGIALTGYGTEGDIERTREAGFVAHLTKPINFKQLEAVIRQTK